MDITKLVGQEIIIIADYDYLPYLLKFKNAHPTLNLKFVNKHETIAKLAFTYQDTAINHLIQHQIEYSKAKKYLTLFKVIEKPEAIDCYKYIKDDIVKNPFGEYYFKNKTIFLFEMDEDLELKGLLTRHHLSFFDLHFADLNANVLPSYQSPNLLYFDQKFYQFFYLFADIRDRLLKNPKLVNKIHILVNDQYDLFYVRFCAKIFKIEVYINYSLSLFSLPIIKHKLKNLYTHPERKLAFSDDALKYPELRLLKELIDRYELNKLDFNYAYLNLLEIVQQTNYVENLEDKGVSVHSNFTFDPDSLVYVTNFQYDSFYKISKDDNVLSDAELLKLGANPSYIASLLDKRKKHNYLKYMNIVLLSRAKQHLDDSIYDSPFVKELNYTIKPMGLHPNGKYTDLAVKMYHINSLDNKFFNAQMGVYNSYDHSFKGVDAVDLLKLNEGHHYSLTNLESYVDCPFKYYIKTLLPESPEDKYYANLGTLIHKVMERVNQPDFDFEVAFNDGVEAYRAQLKHDCKDFTGRDMAMLGIVKHWLATLMPAFLENIKNIESRGSLIVDPNDHELNIKFTLTDENNNVYPFSGYIDKILWSKQEKSYYTIIDYKSGKESFNPYAVCIGKAVQLPLYYDAIKNDDKFTKGFIFGGFAIEHNYSSTFKGFVADMTSGVVKKAVYQKFIRLNGLSNASLDYWHSIDMNDDTYKKDGTVKGSGGVYLANRHKFTDPSGHENIIRGESNYVYNLESLINDAKKALINIIHKIKSNHFPVMPANMDITKPLDDNNVLVCKYCSYSDICYHKKLDAHDYSFDIAKHFREMKFTEGGK